MLRSQDADGRQPDREAGSNRGQRRFQRRPQFVVAADGAPELQRE
jgi:hypothetical protein